MTGRGDKPERPAASSAVAEDASQPLRFELYVAPGFSALEAACVTDTLERANRLLQRAQFSFRYVAEAPGMIAGQGGQIVRAEPAIDNYGLSDVMIVLGGEPGAAPQWLPRVRQMQKQARRVVLLSEAATAYIENTQASDGPVTTHWRDAETLRETGYYPNLSDRLAEQHKGVITGAGVASTAELVIGLIAPYLDQTQIVELGNRLLLPTIRKSTANQPRNLSANEMLFDHRVTKVIRVMEETLSDPLDMPTLTRKVGLSSRQVERVFREVFDQSPAKFYKQLRTKKAWALIEETLIPLAEIAVATGFGSVSTMSRAVRDLYGVTPAQSRARKSVSLTHFAER